MLQVVRLGKIGEKQEFIDKIKKSSKQFNLSIQAVDPELILSERQVKFAVQHAVFLFKNKKNRAKTLENEILLILAATRSFDQALRVFGIKNHKEALLIVFGNNPRGFLNAIGKKLTPVFMPNKEKLIRTYRINKKSIEKFTLEDILLEKMAIAANEK